MNEKDLLETISARYCALLGENLSGIYAHGSIAFGCFHWDKSDIDFIVVINEAISEQTKRDLLQVLEDLRAQAPPKGFEMSVVLERHCQQFIYPTPYELHVSNACLDQYLENPLSLCCDAPKTAHDLAAHFAVIANTGVLLYGKPIPAVFGDIPREHYLDSICKDIENAKEDVLASPVYVILNLCRVYAYKRDDLVLSKEQGGQWGLAHLPAHYHTLITSALKSYAHGKAFCQEEALRISFAAYMLDKIFPPT